MADHGFSERRACRLIGVNRSAWQYEPLRGKDDAVRERMREIANERRRFGYRRLAILLRREGKGMNLKKVYRLYREERLTVRKRGGRKRAPGTRAPMAIPQEPNQRWSLDFVSDSLACGRRFRMLNVIDDYSRECLGCTHASRRHDRRYNHAGPRGPTRARSVGAFRNRHYPLAPPAGSLTYVNEWLLSAIGIALRCLQLGEGTLPYSFRPDPQTDVHGPFCLSQLRTPVNVSRYVTSGIEQPHGVNVHAIWRMTLRN